MDIWWVEPGVGLVDIWWAEPGVGLVDVWWAGPGEGLVEEPGVRGAVSDPGEGEGSVGSTSPKCRFRLK